MQKHFFPKKFKGNAFVGYSTNFILCRKMSTANNHSSYVGILLQLEVVVQELVKKTNYNTTNNNITNTKIVKHQPQQHTEVKVPIDGDSKSLACMLRATMEEACITMVNKNPSKFGVIDKTPRFALSTDFVKNTPYEERSDDDKIPFWAKAPWHLECRESDEGPIKAILSYMYRSGRMARILGKAAFHHLNPGPNATAGERDINAGIVTRHIAMIHSMGRVNLRGLKNPDRSALLQKFDDNDPTELVMEVNKSVRDVLMRECKADKTRVWCLLAHNREQEWVGYYRKGVGNDSHQKYAVSWSGSLSAHLRYFLLRHGLNAAGINQLIKQSFDYNTIVDAANVVQKDGKVVSCEQATAKQKLEAFDKKNSWADIRLGRTPVQQMAHDQMTRAKALEGQYNFNEENSVDPVAHRDGDTVFTKTRDETLGQTMYEVSSKEGSTDSQEARFFSAKDMRTRTTWAADV